MTQIIMEIPDIYTQELETVARSQQKTIQDLVSEVIRAFIESEQSGFDVTKDPVYRMGDTDSDEESAQRCDRTAKTAKKFSSDHAQGVSNKSRS